MVTQFREFIHRHPKIGHRLHGALHLSYCTYGAYEYHGAMALVMGGLTVFALVHLVMGETP